ncbi:MAG: HAD-IIIA family hydrolase [Bacteroidota bacterium]
MIQIDKSWTLFLDRDGVINRRLVGDYVKYWGEFQFIPGVLEAMPFFAEHFGRIVVVTNQQGVGKGLMRIEKLNLIHDKMVKAIEAIGGRIDKVYACTDLSQKVPNCRKPNPGMAEEAKVDFPAIDFKKSIMVGDSITDIQFGEQLGMCTVWVRGKEDEYKRLRQLDGKIKIDYRLNGLGDLPTQIQPL